MGLNFLNSIFLCMLFLTHATKVLPDADVYDDTGSEDHVVYVDTGYEDASNNDNTRNDEVDVYDSVRYGDDNRYSGDGYLTCQCEATSDEDMTNMVDSKTLDRIYEKNFKSRKFRYIKVNHLNFPDNAKTCKTCKAVYSRCHVVDNCEKRLIVFKAASRVHDGINETIWKVTEMQSHQLFPANVNFPMGIKGKRRQIRQASTCQFPSSLETAAIFCKILPSSIQCVQRCIFGHTLEEGITREMQCKHVENKWLPKGFKECKPFADCTATLVAGGSINCTTRSLVNGPECKIACLPFEDKEAVPGAYYTCNIEGKWDPPLPFCAYPNSGMMLVEAPKNKFQYESYDYQPY